MILILCEKPSQARDITRGIFKNYEEKGGYYQAPGSVITWCLGHLLQAVEPEDYDPRWKKWCLEELPILVPSLKKVPIERVGRQLRVVSGLMTQCDEIVIATDPDREGELIAREVIDYVGVNEKITKRAWLSALDPESIQRAFESLRPGGDTVFLGESALAREQGDWLFGMNFSRVAGMALNKPTSIGRVQCPTLEIIRRREEARENFKGQDYYTLKAVIKDRHESLMLDIEGMITDRSLIEKIARESEDVSFELEVGSEEKQESPPPLFSLSLLQRHMNALKGWSAQRTLDTCQGLYENHKAISYPRSDCSFLPEEQRGQWEPILENYQNLSFYRELPPGQSPKPREKVYDNKKVGAHHAIVPTTWRVSEDRLSEEEKILYQEIYERFVVNLLPPYRFLSTAVQAKSHQVPHSYSRRIITVQDRGWKSFLREEPSEDSDELVVRGDLGLHRGDLVKLTAFFIESKKTKKPRAYTEGTLIADMEGAAKFIEGAEKVSLKKAHGIGTEATRASILETLKRRKYIEVRGGKIHCTLEGIEVVEFAREHFPFLTTPAKTGQWEGYLTEIAEGRGSKDKFIEEITLEISTVVDGFKTLPGLQKKASWEGFPELERGVRDSGKKFYFEGEGYLWKEICGKKLTLKEAKEIVLEGKTREYLKFISSKSKKPYWAKIVKDTDCEAFKKYKTIGTVLEFKGAADNPSPR